jgi:hypothetical protein
MLIATTVLSGPRSTMAAATVRPVRTISVAKIAK